MDTFRWISITLSLVLGLGVTRVLSGIVAVFKSRHHAPLDWVPLTWATSIFVLQIQYWWAIIELARFVAVWTLLQFLLLLSIPLVLFGAAALVLPDGRLAEGETLTEQFRRDGRWGLLCLSAYAVLAFLVDLNLFGEPALSSIDWFLVAEFIGPLLFLVAPSVAVRRAITLGYLGLVLWSSWEFSPKAY